MSEPQPRFRIGAIWLFTVIGDDDEEGIPAFRGPGNMAMPMVCSDRIRVDQFRPLAEQMARDLGKPVTLRRFEGPGETEAVFEP